MTNIVDANGLSTDTLTEVFDRLVLAMKSIYGSDINLDQDSPDGQWLMIMSQEIIDMLDLSTQSYNSFDPDNANGAVLDQRVAYNGIKRQGGTYTLTNITVVVDRAMNLYGLDQSIETQYTIEDDAGTEWILETSQVIAAAGTYVFVFRSANTGSVTTIPNTITTPGTIVLGITSVNNPTTYTTLGEDTETDVDLKIRRQKAVSISSTGFVEGLEALLEDVSGVTFAKVWENDTRVTDSDGTEGNTIWCILTGTYDDADIAKAIYSKRGPGCGMRGVVTYDVTRPDDSVKEIRWDETVSEDLFIEATIGTLDGSGGLSVTGIKQAIVDGYIPGVYEQVNINDLNSSIRDYESNALITSSGFSLLVTGPFTDTLTPSDKKRQFVLSTANIALTLV